MSNTYIKQFYAPDTDWNSNGITGNLYNSPFFMSEVIKFYDTNGSSSNSETSKLITSEFRPSVINPLTHVAYPTALAIMPATVLYARRPGHALYDMGFGEWLITHGTHYITQDINAIELYNIYKQNTDNLGPMLISLKKSKDSFFLHNIGNYYGNVYHYKGVCWGELSGQPDTEKTISAYYNSGFNFDLSSYLSHLDYLNRSGEAPIVLKKATVHSDGKVEVLKNNGQVDYVATIDNCKKRLDSYNECQFAKFNTCNIQSSRSIIGALNNTFGQQIAENIIVHYLLTEYKRMPGVTLTLNFHVSIY